MHLRTLVYFFLATVAVQAEDFFMSKVEPLLKERCFRCHSHDQKIKAGLALDSKSGWELGGDSGPAIVPGKPEESLLIEAIRWKDEDVQMPPKEKLPEGEIAILVEWVKQGAPDPRVLKGKLEDPLDWWSLKPLKRPEVPEVVKHPVDAFAKSELSPEAEKQQLIRRLYFDLHGLPPTPADVAAFVKDEDPEAYEKLVRRLLGSPRYGERWARHWLDVIHFADSDGCEHDIKRPNAWRFRDYVIRRLNEDVPWDRFIREQLAADAFYPEETNLIPALGFIAAGPLERSRATTAPITFDYLDRDDMVTQTMGAFVSTTANCARCHSHKFDPISQEDYYSLQAVFAGVGKGDLEYDEDVKVGRQRLHLQQLLKDAKAKKSDVLLNPQYAPVVSKFEDEWDDNTETWSLLNPDVFVSSDGSTLTKEANQTIYISGKLPNHDTYTVTADYPLKSITAIRMDVLADNRLPEGGPGRHGNGNLHLTEFKVEVFEPDAKKSTPLKIAKATADWNQGGWTIQHALDGNLKTAWGIYPKVKQSHYAVFELETPAAIKVGSRIVITMQQLHGGGHTIGRFQLSVTDAPPSQVRSIPQAVVAALKVSASKRNPAQQLEVAAYVLKDHAETELAKLPKKSSVYAVSPWWSHAKKRDTPLTPKKVHLLRRGDFFKPVREVVPRALSQIKVPFELEDPQIESNRRVALANWIASPDNPLTWRSIVNRVWHYHFGKGICETPNDFGRMGAEPTNPAFLDWLAVWFRDDAKGSLKKLHYLILTSQTWKQSGDHRRTRMDAEMFRDTVLQVSGTLDTKMGGPGIEQFSKKKGPQATPALNYNEFDWTRPEAKRRSIYRVVWRGIPDPFMQAIDFPDMALLAPKRERSVSALQSLVLYNNDFVLHASEWFAERLNAEDAGVKRAIQLAYQREASSQEISEYQTFVDKHGMAAFCRVLFNSNEFLFIE